ncbi:MAG: hypothetical protein KatS3mg102_0204 [Planctomycetota bacterium]|nr:MAG: hypothetical protein KatS3mg102_0204 [Planctomycetota bacterium]
MDGLPFVGEGGFDPAAFEAYLALRLQHRPDLARVQLAGLVVSSALALAGAVLVLVRLGRRRTVPPPPGPPARAGWGLGLVAALVVAFPLAAVLAGALAAPWAAAEPPRAGPPAARLLAGALALVLLAAGGLAAAGRAPRGLEPLGLGRGPAGRVLGIGLWYLLLAFPFVMGLQLLSQQLCDRLDWPRLPNPAAALFLTTGRLLDLVLVAAIACVLAPLAEEVLFRGLLYLPLRARLGRTGAIVASAALFAAVHPPVDMPAVFALGVALALAYERAGSLWAPIAAHAANNLYTVGTLLLQRHLAYG